MNCNKCNAGLEQDAVVCASCGESVHDKTVQSDFEEAIAQDLNEETVVQGISEETIIEEITVINDTEETIIEEVVEAVAVQEPTSNEPTQSEPEKPKKKTNWKIIAPVAIVAFLVGYLATSTFFSSTPIATALSMASAFENLGDELGERFENSPFAVVSVLEDILEDGSITVDFVQRSGQGFGMFDTRGSVTMLSHVETDDSAFLVDASIGGFFNVDLDIFLNTERLAARSNMLGNTAYGITFNTFRSDIRAFGPLIGLDDATMDELADFVDAFTESLDNPMFTDPEEYIAPYIELLTRFALSWDMQTRDDQLTVGDTAVDVNVVTLTITDSDLAAFLADLHTQLINDDALRAYINLQDSLQGLGSTSSLYDEFLDEFQNLLDQFDDSVAGQITVELAISSHNRLINSTKTVDLDIDGTPIRVTAIMDLGLSVHDNWTLDLFLDDSTFNIVWAFNELNGMFENKFSLADENESFGSLASEWTPETGNFVLSYSDYQGNNSGSFSGILIIDNDGGFDLRFDESIDLGGGDSLEIGVWGALGANIEQIEYINLDQWDAELIEMIFGLMELF